MNAGPRTQPPLWRMLPPGLWLFLFFCALLIAFRLGLTLYAIYIILGVLIVSRWMARQSLAFLLGTRVVSRQQVEAGESVTISMEVRNQGSSLVLWVLLEDFVKGRAQISGNRIMVAMMPPGKTILLKYAAQLLYRGYYGFGPLLMESGDLFGLIRKFKTGTGTDYVTALPRVVPISRYSLPTHRPVGEVRVQSFIFEDPSRLAGIRAYAPGDSLKRVHWKATARTGIIQSKIFDPTTMIGATVVLDFHERAWEGPEGFERSELAVIAAASVASFIIDQKQQVGLLSNGRDAAERIRQEETASPESTTRAEMRERAAYEVRSERLRPVEHRASRGHAHLQQLLVSLARLEMTDGLTLAETLVTEYHRLPRDAALMLLIGRFSRELGEILIEIKRAGFLIAVFAINDRREFESAVAYLNPEGIRCGHLRNEDDLTEIAVMRI